MQATQLSVHPRDHQTGGIFASPTGMDFERGILGMVSHSHGRRTNFNVDLLVGNQRHRQWQK
jgi:hypothetical protein